MLQARCYVDLLYNLLQIRCSLSTARYITNPQQSEVSGVLGLESIPRIVLWSEASEILSCGVAVRCRSLPVVSSQWATVWVVL